MGIVSITRGTSHLRSVEVDAQVTERIGKAEISDAAAVTIAAGWQGLGDQSGRTFAALVGHSEVTVDDLHRAIGEVYGVGTAEDDRALDMLGTWALASSRPSLDELGITVEVCESCALLISNGECGSEEESEAHAQSMMTRIGERRNVTLGCSDRECDDYDTEVSWSTYPCETCVDSSAGKRFHAFLWEAPFPVTM